MWSSPIYSLPSFSRADNADRLVGKLAYDAPKRIAEDVFPLAFPSLARRGGSSRKGEGQGIPALAVLDVGCGTGLCGAHLSDRFSGMLSLFGCDISSKMVGIAGRRGCYEEAIVSDAVSYLGSPFRADVGAAGEATAAAAAAATTTTLTRRLDLGGAKSAASGAATSTAPKAVDAIVAADVFPYVGDAEAIFAAAARRLVPGGVFIFTTEGLYGEGGADGAGTSSGGCSGGGGGGGGIGDGGGGSCVPEFMLRKTERFAHSRAYLARLCKENGFDMELEQMIVLRMDDGRPINGDIVLARTRPSPSN